MLRVKKNSTTCGCNLIVLSAKLASTIQIMVMKVFKPREKNLKDRVECRHTD